MLRFFDDDILGEDANPSTALLITPPFDGSEFANFYLDFDIINRRAIDLEGLYIYVYDGTESVLVETLIEDIAGPQFIDFDHLQIDLSNYRSETMQVAFAYHDGGGWGWWAGIDNVKISGKGDINDLCTNAFELTSGDDCVANTNQTAIFTGPVQTCGEAFVGGLWYRYSATNSGIIKLETNADFNDVIDVFTGDCNNPSPMACTNADEFGFTGETFYTEVTAGNDYYFRISGLEGTFGNPRGNLCVTLEQVNAFPEKPVNDICTTATPLMLDDACVVGTNRHADFDGPAPSLNLKSKADIWYQFTATTDADLTIETDADFSDVITVFTGACNNLSEMASNDYGQTLDLTDLVIGETYFIQVSGYFATLEGNVCMEIKISPDEAIANEDCSTPTFVEIGSVCLNSSNVSATFDGPIPSCDISPVQMFGLNLPHPHLKALRFIPEQNSIIP